MLALRANAESGFTCAIGIGGIGSGIMYSLHGEHDLGRNESRLGELLDSRDYCKLHILEHYIARLMGSDRAPGSFRVLPIGVVGNDAIGTQILTEMSDAGLDMQFVRSDPALKTLFSVCFIYPDGSGGNITSSNSAARALSADDLRAASSCMKAAGPRAVALCVPEVPLELRQQFLELATHCGNYRVCSFVLGDIEGALRMGLIALTDLLSLNQEEASALFSGGSGHILDEEILAESAARYTATHPSLRMVISVGPKGAYGFEQRTYAVLSGASASTQVHSGCRRCTSCGCCVCFGGGHPVHHTGRMWQLIFGQSAADGAGFRRPEREFQCYFGTFDPSRRRTEEFACIR